MSNLFFYEHIGHMQISVLTLELYDAILRISNNCPEKKIVVDDIIKIMISKGFPLKVIHSEIDRFFYGYECIESYEQGIRYLEMTQLGYDYINEIKKAILQQKSEFAFIIRTARKKGYVNTIIQESTFFEPYIYEIIKNYHFREGGARDFLKCISIGDFQNVIEDVVPCLQETKSVQEATIEECIDIIQRNGKYWSGVYSKYSWIFFKQKYVLNFGRDEWEDYKKIIAYAKRPVEWGGDSKDIPQQFMEENQIKPYAFLKAGIIRKLYYTNGVFAGLYRLTAPGFLIFERKERGFLLECVLRKETGDNFVLNICDASDKGEYYHYGECNEFLKLQIKGDESTVLNYLSKQIIQYKNRGEGFYGA